MNRVDNKRNSIMAVRWWSAGKPRVGSHVSTLRRLCVCVLRLRWINSSQSPHRSLPLPLGHHYSALDWCVNLKQKKKYFYFDCGMTVWPLHTNTRKTMNHFVLLLFSSAFFFSTEQKQDSPIYFFRFQYYFFFFLLSLTLKHIFFFFFFSFDFVFWFTYTQKTLIYAEIRAIERGWYCPYSRRFRNNLVSKAMPYLLPRANRGHWTSYRTINVFRIFWEMNKHFHHLFQLIFSRLRSIYDAIFNLFFYFARRTIELLHSLQFVTQTHQSTRKSDGDASSSAFGETNKNNRMTQQHVFHHLKVKCLYEFVGKSNHILLRTNMGIYMRQMPNRSIHRYLNWWMLGFSGNFWIIEHIHTHILHFLLLL